MADEEQIEYRKLPGHGFHASMSPGSVPVLFLFLDVLVLLMYRRRQLYLGPDHLLVLDRQGYTEDYRFFKYADIQQLTMRSTALYAGWIITFTIKAALMLFWASGAGTQGGIATLYSFAAISIVGLVVHILRGPTVACKLHTAVSKVELHAFSRLRIARSGLAQLRQEIEQAQGRLDSEEVARAVAQHRQEFYAAPEPKSDAPASPSAIPPEPPAPQPEPPPEPEPVKPSTAEADETDSGARF